MNDELKKRLLENMDVLIEFCKDSGAFIKEQAPVLAQELVNREIFCLTFDAIAKSIFVLVLIVLTCFLIKRLRRKKSWDDIDLVFPREIIEIIGAILCLIFCGILIENLFNDVYRLIAVYTAPKVYVLEVIMRMIKL